MQLLNIGKLGLDTLKGGIQRPVIFFLDVALSNLTPFNTREFCSTGQGNFKFPRNVSREGCLYLYLTWSYVVWNPNKRSELYFSFWI